MTLPILLYAFLLHAMCVTGFHYRNTGHLMKLSRTGTSSLGMVPTQSPDNLDIPKSIQNINKVTVVLVKDLLSKVYKDRHYARFAALETIARVPYFSYTSVLHLYETLGWFRKKEYIQIHFAESWNELHHLLIMEALGGNDRFLDRFIATHIAFFYYWIVVFLYISNPAVAYDLNHQVECHAFETYNGFLQEHGEELKSQPAPQIAVDYYQNDPYMLNAFQYNEMHRDKQSHKEVSSMHREVKSLYDVFYNIRADEAEHAETMKILQRDMTLKSRGWNDEDNKSE